MKFRNIEMEFVMDFDSISALILYCSEKFLYWKRFKVKIEMSAHKYSTSVYVEH